MNVADWLRGLGLEQYEAAFRENDVNAELVLKLTAADLKDLGVISVGHRRLLVEAIAALHDPARSPGESVSPKTNAELRPISVMVCDLVGSTALSSRLDAEDLSEVIRAYQTCVATTIRRFDGFIARYVGDGVLIYFGWPQAQETDVERATRAGLAVAAAVAAITAFREPLQVRIGIATGLVVIGEPIGSGDSRQHTAIGETPNRAARLQTLAGANEVVIDAATRRQIGGLFTCRDIGTTELKGLPTTIQAWTVLSENSALGQFEALRSGATPLVGRKDDMELLLRRWDQAKAGKGRVVLISAEPGLGKSRLAEALAERISAEPHLRLRYFCSPHHQDSALYPIIANAERAAGFAQADESVVKRDKLQAMLAATAMPAEDIALMADLLGLPSGDLAPPFEGTPQRKKDKTFDVLLRQLDALASRQPLLLVFDDVHWIDPSSCEILGRVIARIANLPALLLALFRPEFQPPWAGRSHVTALTLARLNRPDTAAVVAAIAGNAALPPDIVEEIAERTDGIPLFIEELTKAMLEAGAQASTALFAIPEHTAHTVPATLYASLMARLDRLGPAAREVAQAGAAIGRDFGYSVLASITDLPEPQLREALDRLTGAGLVFLRGTPPHASYLFKHALVQDAAYGTLLRGRRQRLHSLIAATLENRFPEIVQAQPALLARHCTNAGLAKQAVVYWLKAGQQALARSEMAEAAAQLRKGLHVLAGLLDDPWRQQQELELQVALGSALTATQGWSGPDVGETISRARALAEQLDRPEHLVPLLVGQFAFHYVRAEYRPALALGEQLETIGATRNDPAAQMLSGFARGVTRFFLGQFDVARTVLETSIANAEPAHSNIASLSFDPCAATRAYLALTLACQGYIDQARFHMEQALLAARQLGHTHTLVYLLFHKTWLDWLTRSPLIHLEECSALTAEHGFPFFLRWISAYRGRSLITLGRAEEALALLTQTLSELRAGGCVTNTPTLLTWLAEAHAMLGHSAEERTCLAEAARIIGTTQERRFEAELLYRVPGDLLNAAGDRPAAEQHYRQAIASAERQGAKLFQLRASVSLARLWSDQGQRAEARHLLWPVYDWFIGGSGAPDLQDAKTLLEELT